eukprot:9120687-Pyramimonas_sp.AAC.1
MAEPSFRPSPARPLAGAWRWNKRLQGAATVKDMSACNEVACLGNGQRKMYWRAGSLNRC